MGVRVGFYLLRACPGAEEQWCGSGEGTMGLEDAGEEGIWCCGSGEALQPSLTREVPFLSRSLL